MIRKNAVEFEEKAIELEGTAKNLRQLLQTEKTKTEQLIQKEQAKTEEFKKQIDAIIHSSDNEKQNLLSQLSKEVNEKLKISN